MRLSDPDSVPSPAAAPGGREQRPFSPILPYLWAIIITFDKLVVEKGDLLKNSSDLDQIDRSILAVLSRDGRVTVTDLAKQVGLSKTPCQIRLKRLIEEDFIQGFKARLNPVKMGLEQVAFVEVKLSSTSEEALSAFNQAVVKAVEIEQCHMIAGAFDYLLKIRTSDIQNYRKVLAEVVSGLPFVASTSTHVSMQSVKDEIS